MLVQILELKVNAQRKLCFLYCDQHIVTRNHSCGGNFPRSYDNILLDGELVTKAVPDIGYLHRGMEKMAENMIYNEFLPTTDSMRYIAPTS